MVATIDNFVAGGIRTREIDATFNPTTYDVPGRFGYLRLSYGF